MSATTEGSELRLVSSIRYKLANVSGDEKKLSDALRTQLTPLLERAGSPYKAVRDAVSSGRSPVRIFLVLTPTSGIPSIYQREQLREAVWVCSRPPTPVYRC